jgi:hypothetical protein
MADVKQKLTQLREVEGVTGPLYCLASAKFFAGKVVGLFDTAKHLSDFIHSAWARRNGNIVQIKAAWGHCDHASVQDFNNRVLKASAQLADGNVKPLHPPTEESVEFTYFRNMHTADHLLNQGVPVVVGVAWSEDLVRTHFITIVSDSNGKFWEVDPWEGEPGVVALPDNFSFTNETRVHSAMSSAGVGPIIIPSRPYLFGYYRERESESPLTSTGV